MRECNVAVAIPCYNESITIAKVVADFKAELPDADIYVFDNNSQDDSIEKAIQAGAKIIQEKRQGKGFVVQGIFKKLEHDFIVMVDGDDTYLASDVHVLLNMAIENGSGMIVGDRLSRSNRGMNTAHSFGNWIIGRFLNLFFGTKFKDILSGYRVFTKDCYKNISILSEGFEVETEMTLQVLEKKFFIAELPIDYKDRPVGSFSKIKDFSDGSRIIFTIISLLRDYRPMSFFSWLGSGFMLLGLLAGVRVIVEYFQTGLVLHLPTAVLSIALIIVGFNSFLGGLIVSAINRRTHELESFLRRNNNA